MLSLKDIKYLSDKCKIEVHQAENVISMIDEGMTVPFISRYRKEKTDNLNEVQIQNTKDIYEYLIELNSRKRTIIKSVDEQEKLTEELKEKIDNVYIKSELEDIYLPYKPKRRTKAASARKKGLEPLALMLIDLEFKGDIRDITAKFISDKNEINNVDQAITEAGYIIAEWFSENAECRKEIRNYIFNNGILLVKVCDAYLNKRSKFEQYYDFKENISSMPSHRILAIRRGEKEKILKSDIDFNKNNITNTIKPLLIPNGHPNEDFLVEVLSDSLERLIYPSIILDVKMQKKKSADEKAIDVFAYNLKKLLLSPPAGNIIVMGVDPGFRSGCKIVVHDETGKLLDNFTIFPNKPQKKIDMSKELVLKKIDEFSVKAIVIGNGTASRETRAFFKSILNTDLFITTISEAGASVYSASKVAREEFPDHDVTVRGAISIGRRFLDPLAELVKIDPKSIGVGQYQHDVNQTSLKKKLDSTVISVVNNVGVELNTTSFHLLKYVSGIGNTLAKNIIEYRDKNGKFNCRFDLLNVKKFGDKAFQQSAGFMRISNSENILDSTGIHPESYSIVENMAKTIDKKIENIINNKEIISSINPKDFMTDKFGLPTIQDIILELKTPGRDPRKDFKIFEFTEEVKALEDICEGMILSGVVTNVTLFGAFIDIGIHQDGLVHVSEISHRYISSPEEILSVGDIVRVKVLKVDKELHRITLSIKALEIKKKKKRKRQTKRKKRTLKDEIEELKKIWHAR